MIKLQFSSIKDCSIDSISAIFNLNAKPLIYLCKSRIEAVWLIERVVLNLLLVFLFPEEGPEIFLTTIYLVQALFIEPFYTLAFFPESVLYSNSGLW